MAKKNAFAIASVLVGAMCFVSLLGLEKAILAILFGALALKEMRRAKLKAKSLAIIGIGLAVVYVVIIALAWPMIAEMFARLQVQG